MITIGWVAMMAAMMLPGALPVLVRRVRAGGAVVAAPLFAGAYAGVWALAALAVYALYSSPGTPAAVALVVAGVAYQITPVARACRRRCRRERRSGLRFGAWCVGSTLGPMAVLVAIDPMSLPLMCGVAAIAFVQKEMPR